MSIYDEKNILIKKFTSQKLNNVYLLFNCNSKLLKMNINLDFL